MKRLVILSFLMVTFISSPTISSERNYYQELVNEWNEIFPDRNRNAAGPRFFHHILNKDITYDEFVEFNKLYCAVSGSLIDPRAQPDYAYLNEVKSEKKICGSYYKCCIPCTCDVMKYRKVQKMKHRFKDGLKEFYVLTIKNPCRKKDFPKMVNRDYFCDGSNLAKNEVVELNGRLVIGVFHDAKPCSQTDISKIDADQVTGQYCSIRNNTPLNDLQTGMGDIFIKLAR